MKIFIYILILLALGVIAYNATIVDLEQPFEGDSAIALIGILAALCVILLMAILLTSKAIEAKSKR